MAHFANVDSNNIVTQVLVVSDTDAVSGQEFLNSLGLSGIWVQTSYNTIANTHVNEKKMPDGGIPLRGNYAGINYIYDPVNDVFYTPRPYPSWTISAATNWVWRAPKPKPLGNYTWNEAISGWTLVYSTSAAPVETKIN